MNINDPLYTAWFEKTDHDFVMITRAMVGDGVPWDMVTFHAQQAAEKYLKGFLRFHDTRPPKIHDLSRLLDLCLAHDESLSSLRSGCIELTDAGYQSRYPDTTDDPGEDIGKHAIEIARRISDAVRERVPKSRAQ
jgi:HEPN domain-containing protein